MNTRFYLAVCLLFAGLGTAQAGTLAVDFTSPTIDFTNGAWSLGWEFTLSNGATVTALGFYDDGKNGLTENHDVGIYDLNGTLLAFATVTSSDPLVSWWRMVTLASPIVLPEGTYRIAASTGSENYTWDPAGFTTAAGVTFLQGVYASSATLVYPDSSYSTVGYFGPNFTLDSSAIPEPGTWALGGLGVLALLAARRRAA